jgi:RNA polymerase sigma-70 factor, ECF subfamily
VPASFTTGGRVEDSAADNSVRVSTATYDWVAQELQEVVGRPLSALRRTAYRLLRNTADAEDAVQDALLSACKHLHQFRGDSQISTWLSAIVFNSARMQLRRHSRRPSISLDARLGSEQEYPLSEQLTESGPSPEEQCRENELAAHLQRGVNRLPSVLRKTYQMREVDGFSIEEIAQTLKLPSGTVKARLSRARAKLRKSMSRILTR